MKEIFEVTISVEKEIVKSVEAETKEQAIEWVVSQAKRNSGFIRVLSTQAKEIQE